MLILKFYSSFPIIIYGLIFTLSFVYEYKPNKSDNSLYKSLFSFLDTYLQ